MRNEEIFLISIWKGVLRLFQNQKQWIAVSGIDWINEPGDGKGMGLGACVLWGGSGLADAGGIMLLMWAETAATSQSERASERERN